MLIVTVNPLLHFVNGDFALNVLLCGVQQIFGCIKSVNRLQADGGLPCLAFFGPVGFALLYIFFKFKLPILILQIYMSFIVQIFRFESRVFSLNILKNIILQYIVYHFFEIFQRLTRIVRNYDKKHYQPANKKKSIPVQGYRLFFWRRRRDSNSRAC